MQPGPCAKAWPPNVVAKIVAANASAAPCKIPRRDAARKNFATGQSPNRTVRPRLPQRFALQSRQRIMSLAWQVIVANAKCRSTAVVELRTTFFARCACNVTCCRTRVRAQLYEPCLRRIFAILSALQQDFGPVPAAASPTRLSDHQPKPKLWRGLQRGDSQRCKPESNPNV